MHAPWPVRVIKLYWSTCPSTRLSVIHHPSHVSVLPSSPASSCAPQHNYSHHDKRQAPYAEISKKHRPLLNEGSLAPLCSHAYRRVSSAPGRLSSPSLSPIFSTSVPSSRGLVRGATWRASPAWFISLAPLHGLSGRLKEPTRLQRASARKPSISWNKPFCSASEKCPLIG